MEKGSGLQTGGQVLRVCCLERALELDIRGSKPYLQFNTFSTASSIPQPNTKKEVHKFLGAARFRQIWILGFSEPTKALYKATAGSGKDPPGVGT